MIKINIPIQAKGFFAANTAQDNDVLLLSNSEESAQNLTAQVKFFSNKKVLYLPSFDTTPYGIISPCPDIVAKRAKTLARLTLTSATKIVVTNAVNLITKLPPLEIFFDNTLIINKSSKISIDQIAKFLGENGFLRSASAIDSGEFAIKGEIVDIVVSKSQSYRILFSWNKIESIKLFDPFTQISSNALDEVVLTPASEIILNEETVNSFKNNYLKNFGAQNTNIPLYDAIVEYRKYPAHENLLPLFYDKLLNICDYLKDPIIIYDNLSLQAILEHQESFIDFYNMRVNANKLHKDDFYPALNPTLSILDIDQANNLLKRKNNILITAEGNSLNVSSAKSDIQNLSFIKDFNDFKQFYEGNKNKIIIICASSKHGLETIKNLLYSEDYIHKIITSLSLAIKGINLIENIKLDASFSIDNYIIIAQRNITIDKLVHKNTTSSQKRLKNILAELETLQENELVVHKEHGIGRFLGVEIVEARGQPHDCLKILYAENVKLYVPVENIDDVKKYGDFEVELDKLGGASWQRRKGKLKNRIGEIAAKLIETTAKRKIAVVDPITYDNDLYDKFCARFPHVETEDQLKAIEEVNNDLTSGLIMDRLICGDVGYGKTEVALRASFIVASSSINQLFQVSEIKCGHQKNNVDSRENPNSDHTINEYTSQVALIVPTTILCNQHYKRFSERFKGFGLNIVGLSRLKTSAEIKKIKEGIKSGVVNIVIGTHALLSKNLEFKNLKLIIIDEEQHFGVAQKEILKELKPGVHVLSLSATPIPRTLQMSMVGLKDLSLIAEAPIDRLAMRTSIMPFDAMIIKDALLKEYARGGKSFYVAPRISDIPDIEKKLQDLVSDLKYKIVHGKMSAKVIDETMQEFDDGKFDILISTSIIESGIDIPSANTMIIHKSDQFGLAQSYQLRGRIGRGKVRGYAYFTLEKKKTTQNAIKRLEILQTIDSLGAGFTIASHDMDHRGFGNLIGEEQSGHIKEVGVELYQDMLDEQLSLLSNQKQDALLEEKSPVSINLGLPVFIPKEYIEDSMLRLGIYKRIGSIDNYDEIENFKNEMIDRFGPIPSELNNLLEIVKIKNICRNFNISSLDAGEKGFIIKFYPNADIGEKVLKFINKFPKEAKIKPDNKLVFIKTLDKNKITQEVFYLLKELEIS